MWSPLPNFWPTSIVAKQLDASKMTLGMEEGLGLGHIGTEVGLGPDDIVLDRDPAPPPQKGHRSPLPNFRPISIVAKRPAVDG